jgi:putative endonuclease
MAAIKAKAFLASVETWWLYVLECQGGVLYTGIAKDVELRFAAHVKGKGAMFTRMNRPVRILGKAPLPTKGAALRAEFALKSVPRAAKLRWCAAGLERFIESHRRSASLAAEAG